MPFAPASIAAVGFALAAYPVGVARAWMTPTDAIARTLAVLRFFSTSTQGTAPDATGHKGLMSENHRSGSPWRLMRACPYVVAGLRCAGFTNGGYDKLQCDTRT